VKTSIEIKWCYQKPGNPPKNAKVEEVPMWHYRGWYEYGTLVADGKWVSAGRLVADDGWKEVQAKLDELCPDGQEKYDRWNRKDAPEASQFFPPISEKEAA
jgi:hypothetical protein